MPGFFNTISDLSAYNKGVQDAFEYCRKKELMRIIWKINVSLFYLHQK